MEKLPINWCRISAINSKNHRSFEQKKQQKNSENPKKEYTLEQWSFCRKNMIFPYFSFFSSAFVGAGKKSKP